MKQLPSFLSVGILFFVISSCAAPTLHFGSASISLSISHPGGLSGARVIDPATDTLTLSIIGPDMEPIEESFVFEGGTTTISVDAVPFGSNRTITVMAKLADETLTQASVVRDINTSNITLAMTLLPLEPAVLESDGEWQYVDLNVGRMTFVSAQLPLAGIPYLIEAGFDGEMMQLVENVQVWKADGSPLSLESSVLHADFAGDILIGISAQEAPSEYLSVKVDIDESTLIPSLFSFEIEGELWHDASEPLVLELYAPIVDTSGEVPISISGDLFFEGAYGELSEDGLSIYAYPGLQETFTEYSLWGFHEDVEYPGYIGISFVDSVFGKSRTIYGEFSRVRELLFVNADASAGGDGSLASPYTSLASAVSVLESTYPVTVLIAAATQPVQLTNSLNLSVDTRLYGGYTSAFVKQLTTSAVTLSSNAGVIFNGYAVEKTSCIKDISFYSQDVLVGAELYAMLAIQAGASPTISGCSFTVDSLRFEAGSGDKAGLVFVSGASEPLIHNSDFYIDVVESSKTGTTELDQANVACVAFAAELDASGYTAAPILANSRAYIREGAWTGTGSGGGSINAVVALPSYEGSPHVINNTLAVGTINSDAYVSGGWRSAHAVYTGNSGKTILLNNILHCSQQSLEAENLIVSPLSITISTESILHLFRGNAFSCLPENPAIVISGTELNSELLDVEFADYLAWFDSEGIPENNYLANMSDVLYGFLSFDHSDTDYMRIAAIATEAPAAYQALRMNGYNLANTSNTALLSSLVVERSTLLIELLATDYYGTSRVSSSQLLWSMGACHVQTAESGGGMIVDLE